MKYVVIFFLKFIEEVGLYGYVFLFLDVILWYNIDRRFFKYISGGGNTI